MERLNEKIQNFVTDYGIAGYEKAKDDIRNDPLILDPVKPVLEYFIEKCWPNMQHPALISLTCEALGGDPQVTSEIGAALVLLTGAADMHDDIVDKSLIKGGISTANAKFDSGIVLVAGDILILKSLAKLRDAAEKFSKEVSTKISLEVEKGFTELGTTTAFERSYAGKIDVDPSEYKSLFQGKGAVCEACARIGGIIASGSSKEIDAIGAYGRTLGFLMALRHEFEDLRNPIELRNRAQNETLPLPLFYAFRNESDKKKIMSILRGKITRKSVLEISRIATMNLEVKSLVSLMEKTSKDCIDNVVKRMPKNQDKFKLLLKLSTAGL